MEITIATAVIAAVAAVVGAVVGAIGKGYASRQKLRELEFEYEKRLQDRYLENARVYLASVYVPLSISLTKLNTGYQAFRSNVTIKAAEDRFRKAIRQFMADIEEMGQRGANAVLTTDLDETLQSFNQFLDGSQTAKQVNIKAIVRISLRALPLVGPFGAKTDFVLSGERARRFRSAPVRINIAGISFAYEADEILEAPLGSTEFEERFIREVHTLNVLVKEVTLGSQARENE